MKTQLKNGRWKVTVDRGGRGADRKRITRTVDTEAEAEAVEQALKGRPPTADGRTVLDAVDRYLRHNAARLSGNTQAGYHRLRDSYVAGAWLGAVPLDRLDVDTLQDFYAQLFAGTWKPHGGPRATGTVKNLHTLLRASLNDILRSRDGLGRNAWGITWNPASYARVNGPTPPPRALDDYDVADIGRVLDAGNGDLADLVYVAIATGAREGELAGLRWRDVDLAVGTVGFYGAIGQAKRGSGQRWARKLPKNGRPRRVAVDAAALDTLRERYARMWRQAEAAELASLDDVAVFGLDLESDYVMPSALGNRWNRARRKAGVTMHFHDLRHVNASEQIAGGVPITAAAKRNGWASTRMAFDVYGHRRADSDEHATAVLADTRARIDGSRRVPPA